jgi:hypothetical protein
VYAQAQEVHIAIAVGHLGEVLDLGVDAVHDPEADGVVKVAEDLPCVGQHRIGQPPERTDAVGR